MKGHDTLAAHSGPLRTKVGACFPGQRTVFRGHDLHSTFKHADWLDLYVFGITGRRPTAAQLNMLHGLWVYTSYPDARLWNNRVAALTGTARSTGALAIGAAMAVSEATIYGRQAGFASADFLVRTRNQMVQGADLRDVLREELKKYRHIFGYGRPVATLDIDERIPVTLDLARENGLAEGPYVTLALQVEEVLLSFGRKLRMNYASLAAALLLDMGFSVREYYLFMLPAFMAGMTPCYREACERPEGATFVLRCDQLHYSGPEHRSWI